MLDEEIEVLKARGDSVAEISNELKGAGGRIEILVHSILLEIQRKDSSRGKRKILQFFGENS